MYNYAFSLYFGCSLAWLIVSGSLDIRFYDQLAARGTSTENQWRLQQATCEHGDLAARKWMQKIETIERCFPMSTRFLDPTWCGFLCVHNLLGLEYVGICCNMLGFPTTTETTIETFPNWNPVGTKSDIWHAQIGFWHGGHAADVCIIFNKGSPLQNNCAWSNAYMLNISEYIYICNTYLFWCVHSRSFIQQSTMKHMLPLIFWRTVLQPQRYHEMDVNSKPAEDAENKKHQKTAVRSGNLLRSYWKWPLIVDCPIKNGDFP